MWKAWSLFVLGFVVILLPLLGVPIGAKRLFGLIVGAVIVAISFLIIRESYSFGSSEKLVEMNDTPSRPETADLSLDA